VNPHERSSTLQAIATEVSSCTRCPLHVGRTNAVPGEGHPETEVVFVGEGPGFNEDQQGRPFVGAAGTLLNQLIGAIGWRREDVFITNVVKCRPPGNRDPEPFEIEACAPYLRRQLEVLDPALVVTLGRHSLQTFMPGARIGQAHGTITPVDPATGARSARVLAMYHPAAALRQHSLRQTMLEDMCTAPQALIDSRARREAELAQGTAPRAERVPSHTNAERSRAPVVVAIEAPPVAATVAIEAPPATVAIEAPPAPAIESLPAAVAIESLPAAVAVDSLPAPAIHATAPAEPLAVAAGHLPPDDHSTPENQMELF
jgi:uracil-DNA glycosylase